MKRLVKVAMCVAVVVAMVGAYGKMLHSVDSRVADVSAAEVDIQEYHEYSAKTAVREACEDVAGVYVEDIPYVREDGKYIVGAVMTEDGFVTNEFFYDENLLCCDLDDWFDGQEWGYDFSESDEVKDGMPVFLVLKDTAGTLTDPSDDEVIGWVDDIYSAFYETSIYDELEESFSEVDGWTVTRDDDNHITISVEGGEF